MYPQSMLNFLLKIFNFYNLKKISIHVYCMDMFLSGNVMVVSPTCTVQKVGDHF